MTQRDLGESLCDALATHLLAKVTAVAGLADSAVVSEWPDPRTDLELSQTRVVLAVTRFGKLEGSGQCGRPTVRIVTPTSGVLGTVQYEEDVLSQPLQVAVWAHSQAMRSDVDRIVSDALNAPFWSTVSPIVTTTLAAAITTTGEQWATPASMAGIFPGTTLQVSTTEWVQVTEVRAGKFRATFAKTHAASEALVEVSARRQTHDRGLHLRLTDQFSQVARYDFEGQQMLDDVEGGAASQRQEWRSTREGVARAVYIREVTNVTLQPTPVAVGTYTSQGS